MWLFLKVHLYNDHASQFQTIMGENQSGLTHRIELTPPKLENTLKICFRSCSKFKIFLVISSQGVHIVYFIFCAIHGISST